ncbi:MAG: SMP-30/gluconolactonase/LRE family protein, partial [Thermoanaerobaculia bacterium]|nr:SMP-30/gluconolactonase/LRE family protein [Thermoanaerobaculia bacterium]
AGALPAVPSGYSLARLAATVETRDVEVRFTLVFEDVASQGVGFYVRQNGGYLQQTTPHGQGYAVFVEGFRGTPGIGVWREVDGVEQDILINFDPALGFQNGVPYRVRFRVNQVDSATTLLQAKIWPVGQTEPAAWNVRATDTTPQLQGITGGIALDSWSGIQSPNPITAHTLIDDVEVEALCNPLSARGALETVSETFLFTEGPIWRLGQLFFSDIEGDTIYRLEPPASIEVVRSPSARANGLERPLRGDVLLACEHETRRVSQTGATGIATTLVDNYQGMRFNSPNDLDLRSDGTLYFTDPDYGLAVPGDRELPFNGLFRRTPTGTLVAEWQGTIGANEPNGVALSPDEQRLYATDTQAGELLVFDVAVDGSLSNRRGLASGLTIPDGLCIDLRGNVYVATWASTIEVFTPDGTPWGAIPIPQQATNCAFGGPDLRTLYVTAQTGLYRVPMQLPGKP